MPPLSARIQSCLIYSSIRAVSVIASFFQLDDSGDDDCDDENHNSEIVKELKKSVSLRSRSCHISQAWSEREVSTRILRRAAVV